MTEHTMNAVAWANDLLGSKWGPCICGGAESGAETLCSACKNAQRIDDAGLDWDEEFAKAEANGLYDH